MKLPVVAERNKLGLDTIEKKLDHWIRVLAAGTWNNPVPQVLQPAVAAKATIIGTGTVQNPQFPAVAAKAAIICPTIVAKPEWMGSVVIDESDAAYVRYSFGLPFFPALMIAGKKLGVNTIGECTPSTLLLPSIADLTGITPTTETAEFLLDNKQGTLEQYIFSLVTSATDPLVPNPLLPVVAGKSNVIKLDSYQVHSSALPVPELYCEIYLPKPYNGQN